MTDALRVNTCVECPVAAEVGASNDFVSMLGRSRKEWIDQTRRQPGLLGSTSVKSTGAIPKSAITAGSFASRLTPS
jgi:hypothetical protein